MKMDRKETFREGPEPDLVAVGGFNCDGFREIITSIRLFRTQHTHTREREPINKQISNMLE